MKTKKILTLGLVAIIAFTSFAFTSVLIKDIKIKESTIKWKGYKVTGEHYGSIKLKHGALSFEGDKLTGGSFIMDMTSIKTEDMDPEYNAKLDGHLKNDDFFGVKNHPTASLKITSVKAKGIFNRVNADLTIKGITKPISFDMSIKDNTATAVLKIDRTKYDIKYGSASFFDGLKDKAIKDEFDLDVTLKF